MRTAYAPKSHVLLGESASGKEFGHVAGHQYHDVDAVISRRNGRYRCHIVETWGSAQGYDEEHGRREAIGRGDSIAQAARGALLHAQAAGIESPYLPQALGAAKDAAEEYEADEADPSRN